MWEAMILGGWRLAGDNLRNARHPLRIRRKRHRSFQPLQISGQYSEQNTLRSPLGRATISTPVSQTTLNHDGLLAHLFAMSSTVISVATHKSRTLAIMASVTALVALDTSIVGVILPSVAPLSEKCQCDREGKSKYRSSGVCHLQARFFGTNGLFT
jgi:hypothetical protein